MTALAASEDIGADDELDLALVPLALRPDRAEVFGDAASVDVGVRLQRAPQRGDDAEVVDPDERRVDRVPDFGLVGEESPAVELGDVFAGDLLGVEDGGAGDHEGGADHQQDEGAEGDVPANWARGAADFLHLLRIGGKVVGGLASGGALTGVPGVWDDRSCPSHAER